jgi:hypothetical protein
VKYTVKASRWERGWELRIEGVGVTQSRGLADAEKMVRSYLRMDLGPEAAATHGRPFWRLGAEAPGCRLHWGRHGGRAEALTTANVAASPPRPKSQLRSDREPRGPAPFAWRPAITGTEPPILCG